MTEPNKIKGIVKTLSEKTKGVLLIMPDQSEVWWNPMGDGVKQFITPDIKGNEVELTIVNQEKRLFSFLKVVKVEKTKSSSPQKSAVSETESTKYRAMAVSYAKDLVIGGKVEKEELLKEADSIFSFIIGGTK